MTRPQLIKVHFFFIAMEKLKSFVVHCIKENKQVFFDRVIKLQGSAKNAFQAQTTNETDPFSHSIAIVHER